MRELTMENGRVTDADRCSICGSELNSDGECTNVSSMVDELVEAREDGEL